jgi:hypothetical protein
MAERPTGKKNSRKSRRWIDLGLLAVGCVFGALLFGAAIEQANVKSDIRIVKLEAEALYEAFESYNTRNNGYPGDYAGRAFDAETLDPLRKRGYYKGFIQNRLQNARIDAYGSPDDQGSNEEFWVEMTLARDPRIRFLIAKTDDAPLAGGEWRDGVFILRGGELKPL